MATLFFDVQTIPCQNPTLIKEITRSIKPPANYTQAETIAKLYKEHLKSETEKKYRQTALDGLYGEIFSIAWAIDDGQVLVFWRDEYASERGLLENFMLELADIHNHYGKPQSIHRWVGHYISAFDLRFLWQRCVINQVKPTVAIPFDAKLWDDRVFDTKQIWTGNGNGQASLAALSKALALPEPLNFDGNAVYQAWLEGRYQDIANFNRQAVINARELYRRMNFVCA